MRISLILPYWDRQEAGERALRLIAEQYAGLDLEVVVVDDGNLKPFLPPDVRLNIKRVQMPYKTEPKSPANCWNAGVREATGDIVAISCIEILHETPVLAEMAAELARHGPDGYVLAAAWCPDAKEWHCHSTHRASGAPDLPPGFGRAFLGMMRRSLYERSGGWDEDYREGAGYEDIDFARRLERAGAKPVIRDDLVVVHPKGGANIQWPIEKFLRNEALLRAKWTSPVTFVCLKAGTAYGPEYVNILRDMVARNLPAGYPGRFVCLTDDPSGLEDGIETLPLPDDLERWWGKLYLFKRGLFEDGTRLVFMDLDTVIVGRLDDIAGYRGRFATLRDFMIPQRLGPAIMAWEAGSVAKIWEGWEALGKPRHQMGDLWWLNTLDGGLFASQADILQDLYPKSFCSFKVHCAPYPPKSARVVCFHGEPRPHNANVEWVKRVWRIGGAVAADLETVMNTNADTLAENVRAACALTLPCLTMEDRPLERAVCIVGGGPSLKEELHDLRWRAEKGHTIVAVNGAAHYLVSVGIRAHWHVMIDARPVNLKFVSPPDADEFFIASHCDPTIFMALEDEAVTLFHMNLSGMADWLPKDRQADLISTGSTVLLAAIGVAYAKGYRIMHLYGADSSYTEAHHAYPQQQNDGDAVIHAEAAGRSFKCAPWMVAQVNEFQKLAAELAEADCTIIVHGDGLLPHVAKHMAWAAGIAEKYQLQEAA